MKFLQMFSFTLLSVLAANSQVIMPGRCPSAAVQQKFDAARVRSPLDEAAEQDVALC